MNGLKPRFSHIPPRSSFIKYNARQKTLASWRRVNLEEEEKAQKDNSKSIDGVIAKVMGNLKLERRQGELEIIKVWNNLMDPMIAKHAQPANLVRGTLFVTVDNSVWLNEIVRYRRGEILKRLQYSFGPEMIARISFRVG